MKLISYILLLFITIGLHKTMMVENKYENRISKSSEIDFCSIESDIKDCCDNKKSSNQETKDCCNENCDGLMICCMQLNLISYNPIKLTPNLNYTFYQEFFSYKNFKLKSYLNKILDPPKSFNI